MVVDLPDLQQRLVLAPEHVVLRGLLGLRTIEEDGAAYCSWWESRGSVSPRMYPVLGMNLQSHSVYDVPPGRTTVERASARDCVGRGTVRCPSTRNKQIAA